MVVTATMCFGLSSCDEDEVSVNNQSVSFSADGGTKTVSINSNTDWTVSGAASWLTVSPTQGNNDGAIILKAAKNQNADSRDCILTVKAGDASTSIVVSQDGGGNVGPGPIDNSSVVITNQTGLYSFYSFTLVFKNRNDETLSTKDCGTIANGEQASAKIPTGCTYFYFGFYIGNYIIISPNYYIDDSSSHNIVVTQDMVNSWDAYDASSSPKKAISDIR